MNELVRQSYLSAIGIDNYNPRWLLPLAPVPMVCERSWVQPEPFNSYHPSSDVSYVEDSKSESRSNVQGTGTSTPVVSPVSVAEVLRDLGDTRSRLKSSSPCSSSSDDLIDERLAPFTLSIWRPLPNWLVIDERQAQLALPTEALLHNLLGILIPGLVATGNEEILSWPLVNNTVVPQTRAHAKQALSVWLEVELDLRRATHLLLMGRRASEFFLPQENFDSSLWQSFVLPGFNVNALISDSLVNLLRNPQQKCNLWYAMRSLTHV